LISLVAGCPSGSGFFVNVHKIDARRNYAVASARHAGVDNAPERELEHHIAKSEPSLGRFHEVDTAQTGPCQRMLVRKFEYRHQRATLWPVGRAGAYPEMVNAVTSSSRRHQLPECTGKCRRAFDGRRSNRSPHLDELPLLPLAVVLPRILEKIEAALALAGPENRPVSKTPPI
jgi:hypothetical protein